MLFSWYNLMMLSWKIRKAENLFDRESVVVFVVSYGYCFLPFCLDLSVEVLGAT